MGNLLCPWAEVTRDLDDHPPGFNPETHWLVDDSCDRKPFGLGVRHIEISLAKETSQHKQISRLGGCLGVVFVILYF